MKILFLSRWFPWPPNNGARIRVSNLLTCLAANHTIDLISFAVPGTETDQAQAETVCRDVRIIPYQRFQPQGWKALLGFFSRWPRSVLSTKNTAMQLAIRQLIQTQVYDAVVAFEIDMAAYALEIPRSKARIRILEEIELTTLYEQQNQTDRTLQQMRHKLMWQKWANYINYVLENFDGFTAVSDPELERITRVLHESAAQTKHAVVPNGIDVGHYQGNFGAPTPDTLIYSGALSYGANLDAVAYFLRKIWPLVLEKRPQTKFSITGKNSEAQINQLPDVPNVIFTGYLPDIRPAIAQSWMNIVPLRIGGGTRLKILESLALGTPVVATPKGAEGLRLTPDEDILIADSPGEFARQILTLLADTALRQRLSQQGRKAIMQYDWVNNGQILNNFIEELAAHKKSLD